MVAIDETGVRKTGKTLSAAQWQRDPLSPPFHLNLRWGLRYLHLAVILPLHRLGYDAQAVSVGFDLAPAVRKPGKRATPEQVAEYKRAKKSHDLSTITVKRLREPRDHLDTHGQRERRVLVVGDSSFVNRTVLAPDRPVVSRRGCRRRPAGPPRGQLGGSMAQRRAAGPGRAPQAPIPADPGRTSPLGGSPGRGGWGAG